jgi:hypothetical protein
MSHERWLNLHKIKGIQINAYAILQITYESKLWTKRELRIDFPRRLPPPLKVIQLPFKGSPMVGRSSGTLPTRVQILVLTPFSGFYRIYRRYALSGKRRSRRRRGTIGDFGNLQICRCSVLRRCSYGRVCVHVIIWLSVCACVLWASALYCVILKIKRQCDLATALLVHYQYQGWYRTHKRTRKSQS